MQVAQTCPDCGAPTEQTEDFCGECGTYLDWEPRPGTVEEPATVDATEPVSTGPESDQPRGLTDRLRDAVGIGNERDDEEQQPERRAELPVDTAGTTEPPEAAGTTDAGRPADDPDAPDAAALLVDVPEPTAPQQPGPRVPTSRQPGRPAPPLRKRRRPRPDVPLQPGDLVCGECGAGNRPSRKFCRRCGHDLAAAEVARIPWWRRLFRRRPRAAPTAGTRPKQARTRRRVPRRLLALLGVLVLLVGGGYLVREQVAGVTDFVLDRVVDPEKMNPTTMQASDAQPGHGARFARDGVSNRYWAPAAAGPGRGSFLVATFEEPFRLTHLLITPGVSGKDEEAFLANGRPAELKLVLTRTGGITEVETIEVADEVGPAEFRIGTSDVTAVKIQIVRAHPGKPGTHTAIAEIEFLGRR